MLPENLLKPLSTAFPLSGTDISPNNLLSRLQTNTLSGFVVNSIKLSVVLKTKKVGGRTEELGIGRRCGMDNPRTNNPCKLWDKVCGMEFPWEIVLGGKQNLGIMTTVAATDFRLSYTGVQPHWQYIY